MALKNVTINEPFFIGHFPHRPVMPGVLMLEALAQAAALLSFDTAGPRGARRQLGVLLRRHRRRALQAAGRAGRPADPRGRRSTASRRASASSTRAASVDGETRGRGRADVHAAQDRLSQARWRTIHPTAIVDPAPSSTRSVERRALRGHRRRRAHRRRHAASAPHCVIEGPHDASAATTASSSSLDRRRAAGQEVRAASRRGWRSATATRSASSCTFNRGTVQDAGVTRIGDDNWIMAYVHIAHDCQVGNHTILANNAHARRPRAPRRLGDPRRLDRRAPVRARRRARDDRLPEPRLRRTCRRS